MQANIKRLLYHSRQDNKKIGFVYRLYKRQEVNIEEIMFVKESGSS